MRIERLDKARNYAGQALFILLNIFLAVFITRFFIVDLSVVSGPSMEPTFRDGHYFAVLKAPLFFREPQRFEAVQVIDPQKRDSLVIKRVIGLPGDTIRISQNRVCVGAVESATETCLNEPYVAPRNYTRPRTAENPPCQVPPGWYYVLGDNRLNSYDSRDYGPVPRDFILGLAIPL